MFECKFYRWDVATCYPPILSPTGRWPLHTHKEIHISQHDLTYNYEIKHRLQSVPLLFDEKLPALESRLWIGLFFKFYYTNLYKINVSEGMPWIEVPLTWKTKVKMSTTAYNRHQTMLNLYFDPCILPVSGYLGALRIILVGVNERITPRGPVTCQQQWLLTSSEWSALLLWLRSTDKELSVPSGLPLWLATRHQDLVCPNCVLFGTKTDHVLMQSAWFC